MRVLVTYGTKMGGTAGIAEILGDALSWRWSCALTGGSRCVPNHLRRPTSDGVGRR